MEAQSKKAADAFVSVANGLCEALDKEDWNMVYEVWRNITEALIKSDKGEGLLPPPGHDDDKDY